MPLPFCSPASSIGKSVMKSANWRNVSGIGWLRHLVDGHHERVAELVDFRVEEYFGIGESVLLEPRSVAQVTCHRKAYISLVSVPRVLSWN